MTSSHKANRVISQLYGSNNTQPEINDMNASGVLGKVYKEVRVFSAGQATCSVFKAKFLTSFVVVLFVGCGP